ncbi:MAG: hypothetical protein ACFFG0_16555 [Candidatus Thorarchaeota archaeon]
MKNNELNQLSLIQPISKELIERSIDLNIDFAEIALDSFLVDNIIKEIPVIKSIRSIFKIGCSVKDIFFMKKLLIFFSQYHSGHLADENLLEFKKKIDEDSKYKQKVIDNLVIIIERLNSEKKAEILAKLFTAYLEGAYDWDSFLDLSSCIEQLLLVDFKLLKFLFKNESGYVVKNIKIDSVNFFMMFASSERLKTFGFIDDDSKVGMPTKAPTERTISLSEFGHKFYRLCLHGVI